MNFKKQLLYLITTMISFSLLFTAVGLIVRYHQYSEKQIQNEIQINKRYLFSYKLNDKDPFEEAKSYAVKVLEIKDGFVQFELDEGEIVSCSVEQFLRISTEIKSIQPETTLYDTTSVQRYRYDDGGTGTHRIDWETGEKGTPIN